MPQFKHTPTSEAHAPEYQPGQVIEFEADDARVEQLRASAAWTELEPDPEAQDETEPTNEEESPRRSRGGKKR